MKKKLIIILLIILLLVLIIIGSYKFYNYGKFNNEINSIENNIKQIIDYDDIKFISKEKNEYTFELVVDGKKKTYIYKNDKLFYTETNSMSSGDK